MCQTQLVLFGAFCIQYTQPVTLFHKQIVKDSTWLMWLLSVCLHSDLDDTFPFQKKSLKPTAHEQHNVGVWHSFDNAPNKELPGYTIPIWFSDL